VDVLCADKTGTLTQNKLTLGDPFCLGEITPDQVILAGALASQAENDDTIDLAVLGGLKDKQALKPYQVTHFQPFDPVHKRTEATIKAADGSTFKVTKGAPQVIQELSANAAAVEAAVDKAVNDFAARGFRALGVARADGDGKWQLLGVLPLFDPPREDAKSTIATAAQMGVKIKMVTGDALAIARETAKVLGMGTNILDGATLGDSKTKETTAATKSIEDADGFAQVFPEHKFHIVDVLQKHGHIVGMTGDGVNDAPALKKADCGFAVSGATDAARAAASIVLVAPGLSVIIDALKESRKIFQRMNSYAMYRIAETLRVLLFMTLAIVIFNFYPLTAIMIVMLALLNDGAILSIAYDNVTYRNQPEAWNMRLVLGIATVLGLVGPIAAFGLFYLGDRIFHLGHPQLQTMMYLMLSVAGHLTILQTRTRGPWWSTRPAWILLAAVVGTQAVATLISVYGAWLVTPLGWKYAGIVWGYAFAWFLVTDPVKLLAYKVLDTVKADSAPKPEAKTEAKSDVKAETKPAAKGETKPEAKAAPQPEAKADDAKPDAEGGPKPEASAAPQPDAKAEPKPEAKAAPQPDAKADDAKPDAVKAAELKHDVKAQPETETNAGFTKLMHTTLGDVLLAGLANHPHSVERIVAEAVTKAEAAPPSRARKRTKPKPSRSLSRNPSPSRKPKPSPSRHPKPSPGGKAGTRRRPK
jgi:H+-transporting ATPase